MTVEQRLSSIETSILNLEESNQRKYEGILSAIDRQNDATRRSSEEFRQADLQLSRQLDILTQQVGTFTEGLMELKLSFAEMNKTAERQEQNIARQEQNIARLVSIVETLVTREN
jgi:hypothetical protein